MLIDFFSLAAYCLVISSTPSPNNLMLANTAANFGYRASIPQLFGCQCGVAVHTFVMCLGLGSIFLMFPLLNRTLHILGALYLIYLACEVSRMSVSSTTTVSPWSFTQAALFQVINPKSWIKAITLVAVFMPSDQNIIMGAFWITLVGLVVGLPAKFVWVAFGVIIRRFLSKPLYLRIFNVMIAITLIILALNLLYQSGYLPD